MQQTALNLVAIGIFALTLSTILGPILNIPPAIPALTTLGVLSLLSLDSFRFQGKGGTILLDWLGGAAHRDRVIRHEAGHFLVAYFLGIPITGYTLTAWEAVKQGTAGNAGVVVDLMSKDLPVGEMRLNLERFCTVWMAGIAAEIIVYGSAQGGTEDRQKLQEAMGSLGRPISESQLKERSCTRQAETMIKEHWAAYEALVVAMEKRATVAECCQMIQQHCQNSSSRPEIIGKHGE